jgi:hypothetical protein
LGEITRKDWGINRAFGMKEMGWVVEVVDIDNKA